MRPKYPTAARLLLYLAAITAAWTPGFDAGATVYNYQVCLKWEIETIDSSHAISGGPDNGLTEDQYLGCDNGCNVTARGAYIKVDRGAWNVVLATDPTTGCANFSYTDPAAHVYDITAYGATKNSAGDFLRFHDDPDEIRNGGSYYPGNDLSVFLNDVTLTPGGGANSVYAGNYAAAPTAYAAAAFTLYRLAWTSATNFDYHVGLDTVSCQDIASAHFDGNGYRGSDHESNSRITLGEHFLQLSGCNAGNSYARRKFLLSHEIGHAMLALLYGDEAGASNGDEPGSDSYSNSESTNPNYCYDTSDTYSINTKEWNAVAYREGFAHFVSARTWNDKHHSGAFRWFSATHDLERYGPAWNGSSSNSSGGLLENVCNGTNTGASTIEDVLRFLWDFYNADGDFCDHGEQPLFSDIARIYIKARLNGGLDGDNYSEKMEDAADEIGLAYCLANSISASEYNYFQEHNGVDH